MSLNFKQILTESLMTTKAYVDGMVYSHDFSGDYNDLTNVPIKMLIDKDIKEISSEQISTDFYNTGQETDGYTHQSYHVIDASDFIDKFNAETAFYVKIKRPLIEKVMPASAVPSFPDNYEDEILIRMEKNIDVGLHYIVHTTFGRDECDYFIAQVPYSSMIAMVFVGVEAVDYVMPSEINPEDVSANQIAYQYLKTLVLTDEPKITVVLTIPYGGDPASLETDASSKLISVQPDVTITMKTPEKKLDNILLQPDVTIDNSLLIGEHLALGMYSGFPGRYSLSSGYVSLAEGDASVATGLYAIASGAGSHAEGSQCEAQAEGSHAEGFCSRSYGAYSHAEGAGTAARGYASHSEGHETSAASQYQHVQGKYNIEDTEEKYAHIVGNGTNTYARANAHTLDWEGNAWFQGNVSINGTPTNNNDLITKQYADEMLEDAIEDFNICYTIRRELFASISKEEIETSFGESASCAVTFENLTLNMNNRYWLDFSNESSVMSVNIENGAMVGIISNTSNYSVFLEQFGTSVRAVVRRANAQTEITDFKIYEEVVRTLNNAYIANDFIAQNSISMGRYGPIGMSSFAIGFEAVAAGMCSQSEGYQTVANGMCAHAEGYGSYAYHDYAHAEGGLNVAYGQGAHAEGYRTQASNGFAPHSEGIMTTAYGEGTHAEGYYTTAASKHQHVQGRFNIPDTEGIYAHIVGNGSSAATANIHTLDWNGNAWFKGNISVDGTPTNDNDLVPKKYVDEIVANAVANAVSNIITVLTQSEFDSLTDKDGNIVYIIKDEVNKDE